MFVKIQVNCSPTHVTKRFQYFQFLKRFVLSRLSLDLGFQLPPKLQYLVHRYGIIKGISKLDLETSDASKDQSGPQWWESLTQLPTVLDLR